MNRSDIVQKILEIFDNIDNGSGNAVTIHKVGDIPRNSIKTWIILMIDDGLRKLNYARGLSMLRNHDNVESDDISTAFMESSTIERILNHGSDKDFIEHY